MPGNQKQKAQAGFLQSGVRMYDGQPAPGILRQPGRYTGVLAFGHAATLNSDAKLRRSARAGGGARGLNLVLYVPFVAIIKYR